MEKLDAISVVRVVDLGLPVHRSRTGLRAPRPQELTCQVTPTLPSSHQQGERTDLVRTTVRVPLVTSLEDDYRESPLSLLTALRHDPFAGFCGATVPLLASQVRRERLHCTRASTSGAIPHVYLGTCPAGLGRPGRVDDRPRFFSLLAGGQDMFNCSERPLRERGLLRRPDARCNTPQFRGSHVGVGEGFRKGLRSHLSRAATAVGRLSGSVSYYWTLAPCRVTGRLFARERTHTHVIWTGARCKRVSSPNSL